MTPSSERATAPRRRRWSTARPGIVFRGWAPLLFGTIVLAMLVARFGTGAFVHGLRSVDTTTLVVATLIGAVTTVSCAWRWRLVARGLDIEVPLGAGVAAYYRSQFLNTVLPGGVLGDVHRAVRHGRDVGETAAAARTVVWERSMGQGVQAAITLGVLAVVPSPVRMMMPTVVLVAGAAAVAVWLGCRTAPARGTSWVGRTARVLRADVRDGLLTTRTLPGVVLASAVVVAGHVSCFIVAARAAGSTAPVTRLIPLALVVLLAMSVPMSVLSWGPREGMAAWVFAAAGLGASVGLAAAVVYGVMVMVATLPGLVVLVAEGFHGWIGRRDLSEADQALAATMAGGTSHA